MSSVSYLRSIALLRRLPLPCRTCRGIYTQQCRSYSSRNILKLHERGLWADIFPDSNTNLLIEQLKKSPQTIYSGFDPTADSLHVGNLLIIMALLQCQRAGHNVIALVGGATAMVGDPSGRSTERPLLDSGEVNSNAAAIAAVIKRIFKNHKDFFWDERTDDDLSPLRIVNNTEWYTNTNVVEFLRVAGRNIRLGEMLRKVSVQTRLTSEEGMSFTEFSYQVLQAYDWLYLYDKFNCTLQIGGSDQMGNLVSGYDVIRRARDQQVHGLTIPLITSESGNKFGKTAGNAVWLDPDKTSPFDFYQFFVRMKDAEVENYLKLLTFYPVEDIKAMMKAHWAKPEKREAQKKLAEKVTLLVHGQEGLDTARLTTEVLYAGNPEALLKMTPKDMEVVFKSASSVSLILNPGTSILQMALDAGCFRDEVDARRIISSGGLYVNLSRVNNPDLILIPGAHILPNNITLLRVGKKNYYMVKWLK